MSSMFHPEGKFAHYGGKLGDLMWLNILVLLCALPIVTAGASVTAMHYVLLKLHRDEEIQVTRAFFKSFRENLKQSIILLGIFSVAIYLLIVGIRIVYSGQNAVLGRYLLPAAAAVVLCVLNWSLILQSRYQNTVRGTVRLALIVSMGHPLRSVAMLILAVLPGLMLLTAIENLIIILMAGVALTGFLQTAIYNSVFLRLEQTRT